MRAASSGRRRSARMRSHRPLRRRRNNKLMKTRFPRLILASLLAILPSVALVAQAPLNLQDTMPFDAAVKTATLPNGLTYFIRTNNRPAQRVSMRLAVKAGSMMEADDQLG